MNKIPYVRDEIMQRVCVYLRQQQIWYGHPIMFFKPQQQLKERVVCGAVRSSFSKELRDVL